MNHQPVITDLSRPVTRSFARVLQSSQQNSPTSYFPFEKLSPEIRNHIYGYLLAAPPLTLFIKVDNRILCDLYAAPGSIRASMNLNILLVSKAIHAEASSYFYAHRTFHFHFVWTSRRPDIAIRTFFAPLPRHYRLAVRSISLVLERRHIESRSWQRMCTYLATSMAITHLSLRIEDCSGGVNRLGNIPCNMSCPSDISTLSSPWATALAQIHGLQHLDLHTASCGGELCGFGPDGVFDESRVADVGEEDDDVPLVGPNQVPRLYVDASLVEPCYRECGSECFRRDFVEELRTVMGLRTGQRHVVKLRGWDVGCYRDVVPGSVVVPAAGTLPWLSQFCKPGGVDCD